MEWATEAVQLFAPRSSWGQLLLGKWKALLTVALAGALVGALVSRRLPRWYAANAKLAMIPLHDPNRGSVNEEMLAAAELLPVLLSVLRSRSVADEAAAAAGMASGKALSAHVSVLSERKANMVTVTVEDRDPERARDAVAALVAVASRRQAELWSARSRDDRHQLEARLAEVTSRLTAAAAALEQFNGQNHIVDLDEQVKATVQAAAGLARTRIDKQLGLRFAEGYGSARSPEVQRAGRERHDADGELAALARTGAPTGSLLPLEALPRLEIEHARLERALNVAQTSYLTLTQEIETLRAAEARPAGRVEVLDPPVLPKQASRPQPLSLVFGGALGAAFTCALGILWLDKRRLVESRQPLGA